MINRSPTRRPIVAIARIVSRTPGVKIVANHTPTCIVHLSRDEADCSCDPVYRLVRPEGGRQR